MVEPRIERFARHLTQALDLLQRDAPLHFATARASLADASAAIHIDGEPPLSVSLAASPWLRWNAEGSVELRLGWADLMDLLRGESTFEEAIDGGKLCLRGAVGPLVQFMEALSAGLHGALRAPSLARAHLAYLADSDAMSLAGGPQKRES